MPPIYINGEKCNSVYLNGQKYSSGYLNGQKVFGSAGRKKYTLTLQTDGNGKLTATALEGYEGDTVTLTPTYNTYYRFNNYTVTGGTVSGNTFTFGASNATVKANFKDNTFTASGSWNCPGGSTYATGSKGVKWGMLCYSTVTSMSSNVPSSFLVDSTSVYKYGTTVKSSSTKPSWCPSGSIKNYIVTYNGTCSWYAGGTASAYTSTIIIYAQVDKTTVNTSSITDYGTKLKTQTISGTTSNIGNLNMYCYECCNSTVRTNGISNFTGSWSATGILP